LYVQEIAEIKKLKILQYFTGKICHLYATNRIYKTIAIDKHARFEGPPYCKGANQIVASMCRRHYPFVVQKDKDVLRCPVKGYLYS